MSWRMAHRGEYRDSEWIAVSDGWQCAIPLFDEKTKELAPLEVVRRDWRGSFLETAQGDVIKVAEGYFVVRHIGGRNAGLGFKRIEDPRPHCTLRRRVS